MNTIAEILCSDFQSKGSRFLGFLIPRKLFDTTLKELKDSHPKAVHFVYAYRFVQGNQIDERFSDDNEPRGSAGMPVLNVLRGEDLVDVAMVVVRYFGGVLLGVGGLVRAYSKSVLLCVELGKKNGTIFPFEFCKSIVLECPYGLLGRVEYLAKQLAITLEKEDFLEKTIKIKLFGNLKNIDTFLGIYEQDLKFRS
ncbi:YigZ family protein [Helicobacter sp. 11S02596-1]|uniref:IMPACT family protein n=1 Tax=Helicobacter sp. 11S02596-1 TaxID=1476194 RepID=UPI000BA6B0A1|nr:YigZ family protein [Helicobacter sp. 11S02596-1]PAF44429.1 hypothetical protein BJI48_02580 [Helicobacter sp. 11S02596-1]